jgi:transcriptional regulator GlxA family with amidase domain
MTTIAIVTFDGFNELDSLIALGLINRVRRPGWRAVIAAPTETVTSMNGVVMSAQVGLEALSGADAVLIGSGIKTREVVADRALLDRLVLDPARQLVGSQCSGALVLAALGLLRAAPVCTDLVTKALLAETGVEVLDRAFHADGNLATAGGCLASVYLAAWTIARLADRETAQAAIHYAAPVGEKEETVARVMTAISPDVPLSPMAPRDRSLE